MNFLGKALLALCLTTGLLTCASAADLGDYQGRVGEAHGLTHAVMDGEMPAQGLAAAVKAALPRGETVEFEGRQVSVDNTWLYILLDVWEAEKDEEKRAALLTEIDDRLNALYDHIEQVAEPGAGEAAAAESRARLRQILARAEYQEKKDSALVAYLKEIRRQIAEKVREMIIKILRAIIGGGTNASQFFRGVLFFLIVVGVGAAVFTLIRTRGVGRKREKKRTVLGEELDENVSAGDLVSDALAAARAGDYRVAIRKLYIALLYEMSERGLLELDAHATNREYLARVSRFAPLAAPMRDMTDRFDYVWYGMYPSSDEDYAAFFARYREAIEKVRAMEQPAA